MRVDRDIAPLGDDAVDVGAQKLVLLDGDQSEGDLSVVEGSGADDDVLEATFFAEREVDERWLEVIRRYIAVESNVVIGIDEELDIDEDYSRWISNITSPVTYTFDILSKMREGVWYSQDYIYRYIKALEKLDDDKNIERIKNALDRLVRITHGKRYDMDFVVESRDQVSYRVVRRKRDDVEAEESSVLVEECGPSRRGGFVPINRDTDVERKDRENGRMPLHGANSVQGIWEGRLFQHSLLSREEEHLLISNAQSGDQHAIDKLVRFNMKLVRSIVKKFGITDRSPDFLDCIQVGAMSLYEDVIPRYDLDEYGDNAFATYASVWIYGRVQRYLENQGGGSVRESVSFQWAVKGVKQMMDEYFKSFAKYPEVEVVMKFFDYSEEKARKLMDITRRGGKCCSNDLAGSNGEPFDAFTLADVQMLRDGNGVDVERDVVVSRSVERVWFQLLDVLLSHFERKSSRGGVYGELAVRDLYIFARYAPGLLPCLDFHGNDSIIDIGAECGVARERIRQVVTEGFKVIQERLGTDVNLRRFVTDTHRGDAYS